MLVFAISGTHFLFEKVTAKDEKISPHIYRNVFQFTIVLSFRNRHGPVAIFPNPTANEGVYVTIKVNGGRFPGRGVYNML